MGFSGHVWWHQRVGWSPITWFGQAVLLKGSAWQGEPGAAAQWIGAHRIQPLLGYTQPLYLVGGLEHFICFHMFPYIGNNHPNWLIFVSEGLKPPTSFGSSNLPISAMSMHDSCWFSASPPRFRMLRQPPSFSCDSIARLVELCDLISEISLVVLLESLSICLSHLISWILHLDLDHYPGASPGALHCSPREARLWAPVSCGSVVILEDGIAYFKESSPKKGTVENCGNSDLLPASGWLYVYRGIPNLSWETCAT